MSVRRMATLPLALQLAAWLFPLSLVLLLGWWNLLLPAPSLTVLILLALAGLGWCAYLWRHGNRTLRTSLDGGFWLVLLALGGSSLASIDLSRSWRLTWQWGACILVFYLAVTAFRAGWSRAVFTRALLVVMALALFAAYYQLYRLLLLWYRAGPWPGLLPPQLPRIWGMTNSPNVLAAMLNMGLFLGLAAWHRVERGRPWWRRPLPLWLWWIALIPMLVLPASRSAWVGLLGGALVYFLVWARPTEGESRRSSWRRLPGLALGGAVVMALLIWRLRPGSLSFDANSEVGYRTRFWRIALDIWREHPVLGSGPGTYATYYLEHVPSPFNAIFVSAHNLGLHLLAEAGLVGALAGLTLLVLILRLLWRQRQRLDGPWPAGLLAALTAFAIHAFFDTPESWVLFLAAILLAALVAWLEPVPAPPPATQSSARSAAQGWHGPVRWVERAGAWLAWGWVLVWLALLAGGWSGYRRAALYAAGQAAAEAGQWTTALEHLTAAQRQLPYPDAASLHSQAFIQGSLAARDGSYLMPAIAAYEALLRHEPGWSLNYANLAALYWQAGQPEKAWRRMAQAIDRAPQVPLYQLNYARWLAEGRPEASSVAFQELYQLPHTWRQAPLWATMPLLPATDAPPEELEGFARLDSGEYEAATTYFEHDLIDHPYSASSYLGLGIARLGSGDAAGAARALQRAAAIDRVLSPLGLGFGYSSAIELWSAVLPDSPQGQLRAYQQHLQRQSVLGPGQGGIGNYTLTMFGRLAFPADLLPQLDCFTVMPGVAVELNRLENWYRQTKQAGAGAWISDLLAGDGDGTISCWVPQR